jgi:hypothetical protein
MRHHLSSAPLPEADHSSLRFPAIPLKVEDAIRAFHYVPYTALTASARLRAARGEEDIALNSQGVFTVKGLDRRAERLISVVDWIASGKAIEERTRFHHGDVRATALASHHTIVLGIARIHSWDLAMEYDIQQREAVAHNPSHDISFLDTTALSVMALRPPPIPALSFPSAPASVPAQRATKRQASSDFETSPSKRRQQILCFRCGLLGHLPADCSSTTTAAGKATAPLARGAKSFHSLAAPDGRQFCFNFAKSSSCAFGPTCTNFHGCSICGAPSHGAGRCKSVE